METQNGETGEGTGHLLTSSEVELMETFVVHRGDGAKEESSDFLGS